MKKQYSPSARSHLIQKKIILVADDDPDARAILNAISSRKGYAVLEAADGKEALELALSKKPSLVVLDLQMPHVSGVEVARAIRGEPSIRNTPIIAVTGRDHCGEALEAGCDECLRKPIEVEVIEKFLDWFLLGSKIWSGLILLAVAG